MEAIFRSVNCTHEDYFEVLGRECREMKLPMKNYWWMPSCVKWKSGIKATNSEGKEGN